jgi:ABC-type antimicrobial peptide transport system permease subunit
VLPFLRRLSALFTPDAFTLAVIVGLLLTIAIAACLVPAIRVSRLNPAMALRDE